MKLRRTIPRRPMTADALMARLQSAVEGSPHNAILIVLPCPMNGEIIVKTTVDELTTQAVLLDLVEEPEEPEVTPVGNLNDLVANVCITCDAEAGTVCDPAKHDEHGRTL